MSPFYNFSQGISLESNGTPLGGVSTLNLVNGSVTVSEGVAAFTAPEFVITNGTVTVTNPPELIVTGAGQTLTANITSPSIVQKNGVAANTVTTNTNVTPGNVLLVFRLSNNSQSPTPAGWTQLFFEENDASVQGWWKIAATTADGTFTSTGDAPGLYIFEIENAIAVTGGGASVTAAATIATTGIVNNAGDLVFVFFMDGNTTVNYSVPEPSGAVIEYQVNGSGGFMNGCLIAGVSPANNSQYSCTISAHNEPLAGFVRLTYNASSVDATLNIP